MPRLIEIAKEVLGDVIANALNTEGCSSVEEFLKRYELIRDTNEHTVGEQNIALLRCAIISKYKPLIKSGQQLSRQALERTVVLRTGSSVVDKLLGGGLYSCEVVEIYGPAGKGKTQLAFFTTALACLNHHCNVIYVDTTGCFSSERMMEIFHKYEVNKETSLNLLKKIMVCPTFDAFELQSMLYDFISARKSKSIEFDTKVKLLVIDNITSLLSPILGYKSAEGYSIASSVGGLLRRVAVEQHIAVLMINRTVTGQTSRGLPKPALGIQWQHTADKQLLMTGFNNDAPLLYRCQLTANRKQGLVL